MQKPPIPENESERLSKLRALKILDTPIEERFERITRLACHSLGVPISAISLVDEDRQWFKSIQGLDVAETSRDVAFCAHAIMNNDAMIVTDASLDPRFSDNPLVLEDPSIRFYAGYPLDLDDNIRVGTLCAIDRKPREFSQEQREILKDLAEMVKSELESISLTEAHQGLLAEIEDAERAALIDPLSRLWNRAGGNQFLRREWEVAIRSKTSIAIAMIDIDYFKKINDTYGHAAGDVVIKQMAETIVSVLRPYDIVCRWGGEEFLVILPGCARNSLEELLGRLVQAIRAKTFDTDEGAIKATASIGATAVSPPTSDDPEEYIKLADKYLYQAKEHGRDRYLIGNP